MWWDEKYNEWVKEELDFADKKKIHELEDILIEIIQNETQRVKRLGEEWTVHWWVAGQLKAL